MTAITKFIETSRIRLDGGTQPREAIDEATVADYAEAMRDGADFPPVVVFNDGSAMWLADGFHRFHATRAAGFATIKIAEHQGTRRDAMLYGFGANAKHGLRETRADKRRKIEAMLRDSEWVQWSDREIARKCGVDHKTVSAGRAELVASGEIPQIDARTVERAGSVFQQAARQADVEPTTEVASSEIPMIATAPQQPAAKVAHAAGQQITDASPQTVPAMVNTSAQESVDTGEVERLRQRIDDLHGHLDELACNLEEAQAEIEALHRITDADDQIKAALDEVRRVTEHNRVLEERIRGLTNERNEATKLTRYWKSRAERLEKGGSQP